MGQDYDAWYTEYPRTHERAGQTVEVVTRSWVRRRTQEILLMLRACGLSEAEIEVFRGALAEVPIDKITEGKRECRS